MISYSYDILSLSETGPISYNSLGTEPDKELHCVYRIYLQHDSVTNVL